MAYAGGFDAVITAARTANGCGALPTSWSTADLGRQEHCSMSPAPTKPASLLSPRQQLVATFLLAFSNLMVVLDLTIANVSVPHIAGNLGVSMDQGAWIITSYAVAEAICVPLTGWLVSRYGVVRVFTVAMAGFGVFSLLCGIAPTLGVLVACRIGQGIAGAPIMPASQTLLYQLFEPKRRPRVMAIWSMTTMLGPAIGPILGGYISDNFSWHWIFLINVPIAIVCCYVALLVLRRVETATSRPKIDIFGLALLVFWIACLQIMLDLGNDRDWFGDWQIVALAVSAFIGFCAFVIWELTEEHPVVDLRIFRHRGFTVAVTIMSLCFGGYFAGIVVIPQWLQTTMGYPAALAGLASAFTAVTGLIAAPIVARFGNRVDPRLLISGGALWIAVCTFARASWSTQSNFWHVAWPQIAQGLAMPTFMIPLTMTSLNSVEPRETASAAGMQSFVRTITVAISTSVVLTFWSHGQRTANVGLAGSLDPGVVGSTLDGAGLAGQPGTVTLANAVDVQARTIALDKTFLIASLIQVFVVVLIWFAPRVRMRGMDEAALAH